MFTKKKKEKLLKEERNTLVKYLQPREELKADEMLDIEENISIYGEGKEGIMFLISHPTKADIENGSFVNATVKKLQTDATLLGYNLRRDCYIVPIIPHRIKGNTPSKADLDHVRPRLKYIIEKYKPKKVVPVGRNATYGLIGHNFSIPPRAPFEASQGYWMYDEDFDAWVGWEIPDQEYETIITPLYNMFDVFGAMKKNKRFKNVSSVLPELYFDLLEKIFTSDTKFKPVEKAYKKIIYHPLEAVQIIQNLHREDFLAFDYETTGLKPFDTGHKIKMVSFSSIRKSYSFPIWEDNEAFMNALRELFTSDMKFVAHNAKFEYNWTRTIFGVEIKTLYYDTMIVSHILDNRKDTIGLKFQTYVNFGVAGYDREVKKLLKSITPKKETGTNGLNMLQYLDPDKIANEEIVWDKLLTYVLDDAYYTAKLMKVQEEKVADNVRGDLPKAINFFHKGTMAFADLDIRGFKFDYEQAQITKKEISKQVKELKKKIFSCTEYSAWTKEHPDKQLNINSSKQLQELFFTLLEYTPINYTKTGNPSTNADALEKMGTPMCKLLLDIKKLSKIQTTFINGYRAEANEDGYLRGIYNLGFVKSYRGSASDPGLNQVAKRGEYSHYVRELLKPHPGQKLIEADFKSLEVCISACYHEDKNMITYVTDPKSDMHRDSASDAFFYDPEELPKELRQIIKSGFVFKEFYGGNYRSAAPQLWYLLDEKEKKRLSTKGIKTYEDFEKHMKEMEYIFWHERFPEYYAWRWKQWREYVEKKYITAHTGFIYTAQMDSKQTSNYPIQGSSFHCLLFVLIEINNFFKENNMQSKVIGEVHDSLVLSVQPGEEAETLVALQEALKKLRKEWKWIIVPLTLEVEMGGVDEAWNNLKEVAKITEEQIEQTS